MSVSPGDGVALARVFRASQLATPLADAVTVELREEPAVAAGRLAAGRFDQAPVVDRDGRWAGWVLTARLADAGSVRQVLRPLASSTILSVDAPVKELLAVLAGEQLVFLAGHRGLEAFVTPSDLDRHAARGHFYLLLSAVEMRLADLVDARVPFAAVEAAIRDESREVWLQARARNGEARPVEYLNVRELAELFEASVVGDGRWDATVSNMLRELCRLRPTVMHPVRPLRASRPARQLAQLAEWAQTVTDRLAEFDAPQGGSGPDARFGPDALSGD